MNESTYTKSAYYLLEKNYLDNPLAIGKINLYQIGRRFCLEKSNIATHIHLNWFELTIVTGGQGVIFSNGVDMPVKEGDIFLSFPYESHGITSDTENPLKYDFFSFYCTDENLSTKLERIIDNFHSPTMRKFLDEKISYLVGIAIAEINNGDFCYREIIESALNQVVIYLIRDFTNNVNSFKHLSNSEVLCYRVMSYIDSHLYTIKNLSDLVNITNYNLSYLSTLFKNTTNTTLIDYYRKKKLASAKVMLKEGKLKVNEISSLLNYSSVYSFSKAFKNEYGISPKKMKF